MENNGKNNDDPFINRIYFNKYIVTKKLGEGSFGMIYMANNGEEKYALKFENKKKGQSLLESEAYIMSYLKGPGIPYVKSYGYSGDYNILVMELLGKSLEDIFIVIPTKKFSIKTTCILGYQMVNILQYIHSKHIIHRDIKPDNFVVGLENTAKFIYLLDFGLAKKFRSSSTLMHYPMTNKKKLTGTARYASINALKGLEQSRRDDLEAVGYVLMYFLRGSLPWQGLPVKNKEDRYQKIMDKKRTTMPDELCQGFPHEFEKYIDYTRNLLYEEDPDYDYLKKLFIEVLKKINAEVDYIYDWTPYKPVEESKTEKNAVKECTVKTQEDVNNKNNGNINQNVIENSNAQITVVNNYLNQVNNIVINSPQNNEDRNLKNNNNRNTVLTKSSVPNTMHAQREDTLGYLNLKSIQGGMQSSNIKIHHEQSKPSIADENINPKNAKGEITATKKVIKDNKCCIM